MNLTELRDPLAVQTFLELSGHYRCVDAAGTDSHLPQIIQARARALLDEGQGLPPLGLLADFWLLLELPRQGLPCTLRTDHSDTHTTVTHYEDLVLGRLLSNHEWKRIVTAWATYAAAERDRVFTFIISQLQTRLGLHGFVFLWQAVPTETLSAPQTTTAARIATEQALAETLTEWYRAFVSAVQQHTILWDTADLFEIEQHTASAPQSERLALRQVIQAATVLEPLVADCVLALPPAGDQVTTNWQGDDSFPVGGYQSLTNRGSIESLLHSQLALMETDRAARPDLFDIRFLRDELLYYARDDATLVRPRMRYVWLLGPGLESARVKDPGLPCQRHLLMWSLFDLVQRTLRACLQETDFTLEIVWLNRDPFALETQRLLELLFRDLLQSRTLQFSQHTTATWSTQRTLLESRELCRGVIWLGHPTDIATSPQTTTAAKQHRRPWPVVQLTSSTPIWTAATTPAATATQQPLDTTDPWTPWRELLRNLLTDWSTR